MKDKKVVAAAMRALMVPEHEMVDSVAAAILAERKRCAEVARMFAGYTDSRSGEAHSKEAKRLAEDTAAWIWTEIMEPCQ